MSASTSSASALPGPAKDLKVSRVLGNRRRRINLVVKIACSAAMVLGMVLLGSILLTLIWRGAAGLSLTVFTQNTKPPGSGGGLLNAIAGTLIQTAIGTAVGTPIGLMVGTYLAEYGHSSPLANAVRFVSDVLLSAPSILIGLFVYEFAVDAVRRVLGDRRVPRAGDHRDTDRRAHHGGHAAADRSVPA